jgi:SpoVK/Ycf46/Vps4 family AAA+-type ATPase
MKEIHNKPVLSDDLEDRITDAIQAFLHKGLWKEWGLDKVRDQGAAILLHGPPGTGKSITAYYIARRLKARISELSFAEYGSHVPGELARNIKKFFGGELLLARQEKVKDLPIIFMDECDAMLVSRNKLGPDMVWMLEPINALLMEIAKYPGLVILATNQEPMLDEALDRRLLAKIRFKRPDESIRYKIWKAKWPDKFPYQPTDEEYEQLAKFDLSGAQIENAFLLWAGHCMRSPSLRPTAKELGYFMANKLNGN